MVYTTKEIVKMEIIFGQSSIDSFGSKRTGVRFSTIADTVDSQFRITDLGNVATVREV
jgi:hypothetical protein